jgi:hypothetical protein
MLKELNATGRRKLLLDAPTEFINHGELTEDPGVRPAAQHDHLKGISEVLQRASKAEFVCSVALQTNQFLSLLGISEGIESNLHGSGLGEIRAIRKELNKRRKPISFAILNRLLLSTTHARTTAISPADKQVEESLAYFVEVYEEYKNTVARMPSGTPNHTSVVIDIDFLGHFRVLLGADLEQTADPLTGWNHVS